MTMMMVVVSIPMPITPISTVAIRTTVPIAVASSQSRPEQETQSELALGSSSINRSGRVIGGDQSRNFRTDWNSGVGVGFQWHYINHLLGSAIRHHRQADLL